MSRSTFQRLRVFSVVGLCLLLSACCSVHPLDKAITQGDEVWCAPNTESGLVGCIIAEKGEPICPVELNVVQCFFYGYELAPLRPEPLEELRKALHDALELPIEELEKKRYVGDNTIQNPSAVEIIGRYFGSNALIRGLGRVWYKTDGFLPALKQPESVPALKKALAEVDEAIRRCEETKDCLEPF